MKFAQGTLPLVYYQSVHPDGNKYRLTIQGELPISDMRGEKPKLFADIRGNSAEGSSSKKVIVIECQLPSYLTKETEWAQHVQSFIQSTGYAAPLPNSVINGFNEDIRKRKGEGKGGRDDTCIEALLRHPYRPSPSRS